MKHYRQLLLILTYVIACLCLSHPFFTEPQILFSAQIEAESDFKARVFWTEDETQKIDGKLVVTQNVSKGVSSIQIIVPAKSIYKFRFDFGQKPGKVIISNMKIKGNRTVKLDPNLFRAFHDVESHTVVDDKLVIESDKKNPYMIYSEPINIKSGTVIDWCLLLILFCVYWFVFSKGLRYLGNFKILENHSRIDIVFVSLFFILLFIPMMHISHAEKSEQENRTLAKHPSLFLDGKISKDFGNKFNDWFGDHFWGRDMMFALYSNIKYSLNSVVQNDFAMVGQNGFMYTKKFNAVQIYQNANLFTIDELKIIGNNMEKFITDAKAIGVRNIYFMLSNDKESIYPEYYPTYIMKKNNTSRLEQVLSYIRENYPEIKLLNFKENLDKIKDDEIIFYKTDTHMNNIGAYYEYYFLINAIKKDYPEINPLTLNDLKIKEDYIAEKDIYNTMGNFPGFLNYYSKENFKNKMLSLKEKSNVQEIKLIKSRESQHHQYIFINEKNHKKLKLLIVGDSFVLHYLKFLKETFYNIHYLYTGVGSDQFIYTPDEISDIYNSVPNILVVETTERGLGRFLTLKFPKNFRKEN